MNWVNASPTKLIFAQTVSNKDCLFSPFRIKAVAQHFPAGKRGVWHVEN